MINWHILYFMAIFTFFLFNFLTWIESWANLQFNKVIAPNNNLLMDELSLINSPLKW